MSEQQMNDELSLDELDEVRGGDTIIDRRIVKGKVYITYDDKIVGEVPAETEGILSHPERLFRR